MRVAVGSGSSAEVAALRRLLAEVPAELAWTAGSARAVIDRWKNEPADVLVVCEGAGLSAFDVQKEAGALGAPVVIVVGDPKSRVHDVYRALELGAAGVATTPVLLPDGSVRDPDRLAGTLRGLSTSVRGARTPTSKAVTIPLLLIAASTGGPGALASVLCGLDPKTPSRVLVAQHIDDVFSSGLADWLSQRSGRRVEVAEEGTVLDAECVRLVRSDRQPTLDTQGRVRYRPLDPKNPFHPCIDTMFESCSALPKVRGVAALLTGMGADGARGLLALRNAGWITLAQDAQSSVVFGMPRAAAEMGAAVRVLPLDAIAGEASRALRGLIEGKR